MSTIFIFRLKKGPFICKIIHFLLKQPLHFYPRLSIFIPFFVVSLMEHVTYSWFYLFRLNKVKCGEGKIRAVKLTQKICHQIAKFLFLPPFLRIIVNFTDLVYGVANKFCSSISIYKVRLLQKFQIVISSLSDSNGIQLSPVVLGVL